MRQRQLSFFLIIAFISGFFFYSGDVSALKEETPVLKNIQVNEEEKNIRILIEGSSPLTYTIFKLSDPLRIVVDLAGAEAGTIGGKITVGKDPVLDISTTQKENPSKMVRIEIGLSSPVDATPSHQDNKLFIDIPKQANETKREETAKPDEASPGKKETETDVKETDLKSVQAKKEVKKETPAIVAREGKPKRSATAVTEVKVEKEGGLKVIISGNGEMRHQAFILKPNRLVIDIPDTVNKAKPVTYVVGDPALNNVRIGQHTGPGKKVRVVLDLTSPIPYEITNVKNQLIINLKAGQLSAEPLNVAQKKDTAAAKNKASTSKKGMILAEEIPSLEILPLAQNVEEPAPSTQKDTPAETGPAPAEKPVSIKVPEETTSAGKYTGKKISLDFQDADIISILRLIAEVSGMNIIASPDVKGKITVKMLNVPWDQALDIILKTYHLGKVSEDNIIRVAPIPALEKERTDIAKAKDALEKSEDLVSKIIPLSYSKPGPMKSAIDKAKVLTPRGNVSIDERTNTLIVKDIQRNISEVLSLIEVLDKPTPQVSIEAKIVEASTNFSRELGIQWGFKHIQDAAHGNPLPYIFPHSMTAGGSTLAGTSSTAIMSGNPWAVNLPAAVGAGAGGALGITLGSITNALTIDLQISAMEGTGQGRILSNPKIVTLDNEKAIIKQGKKIPYLTVSAEGTQTAFIDAVLSLTVTPTITPGGSISMEIEITKNEADFGRTVLGVPSIDTKEAKTNVLVHDGETIVIGGIMKTTKSESTAGVPLLHRIPILGWFFKKEVDTEDTTELLIFITPRIVKPA